MERRKRWITGLVLLLMGVTAYIGTSRWMSDLNVPLLDGSTITIVPGVHLIGGLGPSAAYVVETSEGLVLIDTGLEADAQTLKSEIVRLGLDWKRLRAIFLTHVHGDHCGGAERLRAETGARIHAGSADAPFLVSGKPREAFFSTFKMTGHTPHPTTVDVELQGDETISIGDVRFRVLDTPGHTTGSVCYLMEKSGRHILFSGDVIYRLGDKPLGTYSTYLAPRYRGDARSYLTTLRILREMPVPDLVLPGHPRASRGSQSPRLSQEKWDEILSNGIREMERLIVRFELDGPNFLDGNPKRLLPELYYFGDFQGAAIYGFFAKSQFFIVDAPGGPGLTEFLNEQQRELGLTPAIPFAVLLTGIGESETAGLKDLVERHETQVVCAWDCIEALKLLCPSINEVVSANELGKKDWFTAKPIPLGGAGLGRTAYQLRWANKIVLFSGVALTSIDIQPTDDRPSPTIRSGIDPTIVVDAIRRLININPDLWLPSFPLDEQNANLYEGEWNSKLEKVFRSTE